MTKYLVLRAIDLASGKVSEGDVRVEITSKSTPASLVRAAVALLSVSVKVNIRGSVKLAQEALGCLQREGLGRDDVLDAAYTGCPYVAAFVVKETAN